MSQKSSSQKTDSAKSKKSIPSWLKDLKQPLLVIIWAALSFGLANGVVWLIVKIITRLLPQTAAAREILTADSTGAIFVGSVLVYGLALLILLIVPRLLSKKIPLMEDLAASHVELGFDGWLPTWRQLILGVVGFVAAMVLMFVITLIVALVIPGIDINQAQDIGFATKAFYSRKELVMIFVTLVVLAPVTEEILFRGYLYGKLRSKWPVWATTIVVSVLFGLAHGQANVAIMTASMSIVMCITRELSDSIYPGIIIHAIKNGLAFWLMFVLTVKM